MPLNNAEHAVLQKLFSGNHPDLARLRTQLSSASVSDRSYSGAGFFTDLVGSESAPAIGNLSRLHFGDVVAKVAGLEHGMGFLVLIENGFLCHLEGYTFGEPCHEEPTIVSLEFDNPSPRDLSMFDLE